MVQEVNTKDVPKTSDFFRNDLRVMLFSLILFGLIITNLPVSFTQKRFEKNSALIENHPGVLRHSLLDEIAYRKLEIGAI